MSETTDLDGFDRKLIAALQADARLSNNELAEKIGLSASQCSRRRARLEEQRVITGYRATVDKEKVGFGLTCVISVTLATHSADSAEKLVKLFDELPNVQEVNQMTGDMDYYVKVVAPDLKVLNKLISEKLLVHDSIQNVKTAIVLETLKDTLVLPL